MLYSFIGSATTVANAIIKTQDGNFAICGKEDGKVVVYKVSPTAQPLFVSRVGINQSFTPVAIAEDASQNLYVCGNVADSTYLGSMALYKFSPTGDSLWYKTYVNGYYSYAQCIITTPDNNLLIAAGASVTDGDSSDNYILKIDVNGNQLWANKYVEDGSQLPLHILATDDGGYLLTGKGVFSFGNITMLQYLKVDVTGTEEWSSVQFAGPSSYGNYTIQLADGNFLTCGEINNFIDTQMWLVKIDDSGNKIWEWNFGNENISEHCRSLVEASNGNYIVTGLCRDNNNAKVDGMVVSIASNNNIQWYNHFGIVGSFPIKIFKENNSNYTLVGQKNNQSTNSIFITRTDANGNFIP